MQIQLSATGTADAIKSALVPQIKRARGEHAVMSATLASLQDDLVKGTAGIPGEVTVEVTLTVRITRPAADAPVVLAAPAAPVAADDAVAVVSPTIKRQP